MASTHEMDSLHTYCKHLPKIELHSHLNGSIREHTLVELARERNVTLPPKFLLHELEHHDADREALLFNNKPRSLKDCFDIFAVIPKCVNDLEVCCFDIKLDVCTTHRIYHHLLLGSATNYTGGIGRCC